MGRDVPSALAIALLLQPFTACNTIRLRNATLRSVLPLRLEKQSQNAQMIAEFLESHRVVNAVYYPGLVSHRSHALARRQMRFFGPVVSFELSSRLSAERFLKGSSLLVEATSFGGIVSSAERRARWGQDAVSEGFIRLSAGCEDIEDLLADLDQALTNAASVLSH